MTEWRRGYRQAEVDVWGEYGYLAEWELQKYYPEDFQRGYRTCKNEIEEMVDNEAQARTFG